MIRPYPFYAKTFAIEIDHGAFLARYGEVQETAFVRKGDHVVAGQPIAKVGHPSASQRRATCFILPSLP